MPGQIASCSFPSDRRFRRLRDLHADLPPVHLRDDNPQRARLRAYRLRRLHHWSRSQSCSRGPRVQVRVDPHRPHPRELPEPVQFPQSCARLQRYHCDCRLQVLLIPHRASHIGIRPDGSKRQRRENHAMLHVHCENANDCNCRVLLPVQEPLQEGARPTQDCGHQCSQHQVPRKEELTH